MHYHLNPWFVLSHFLLSLVVLTLAVVLVMRDARRASTTSLPAWVPWAGLARRRLGVRARLLRDARDRSGTASGQHGRAAGSGRSSPRCTGTCARRRCSASRSRSLLVYLVRAQAPQVRGALVLLGLLAVQMTIGEMQYRTHLPWWLVLVHVTVAATVWVGGDLVRLQPLAPA